MYITVRYSALSNKATRWISLNDNSTVADVESVVNTLRCIPGVEDVYVNVKDSNNAKKTDNSATVSQ